MNKFRFLQYLFAAFAVLLSDMMCATVAYNYCSLQWGALYKGSSAPPVIAFLFAIPYLAGMVLCTILAYFFCKKSKTQGDSKP